MKILITQRKLLNRGGSEMFALEVSRELRNKGHEVAIYTSQENDLAMMAHSAGVQTTTSLEQLPFVPDVIHGQHHMQFMAALAALPGVPALSYCHGPPWLENPPLHPRIHRYVAMCESMVDRLVAGHHVPRTKIRSISNFFDPQRFTQTSQNRDLPKKAIMLLNVRLQEDKLKIIEEACRLEGYSFTPVGSGYGNATKNPEKLLPQYKVAFAMGRSAVEAMACGCAVIPLNSEKIAPLITIENFEERAFSNFCPRLFGSEPPLSVETIRQELQAVDSTDIQAVTSKVRSERTLTQAVGQLESLYFEVLEESKRCQPVTPDEDLKALAVYFSKIIPQIDRIVEHQERSEWSQYLRQQQNLWRKLTIQLLGVESPLFDEAANSVNESGGDSSLSHLTTLLKQQKTELDLYKSTMKQLSKTFFGKLLLKCLLYGKRMPEI